MIPPNILTIASIVGSIIANIGGSIIGEQVSDYLKKRFKIFQKEYEATEGDAKIIILQKELLDLKSLQIKLLEEIITGDYSEEEENKMLKEFKQKTVFVSELEKLLK